MQEAWANRRSRDVDPMYFGLILQRGGPIHQAYSMRSQKRHNRSVDSSYATELGLPAPLIRWINRRRGKRKTGLGPQGGRLVIILDDVDLMVKSVLPEYLESI